MTTGLTECVNKIPLEALKGKSDYVLVFESEEQIKNIKPNLEAIGKLDARGLIVTAPGNEVDFCFLRFFAPQSGINEDPVTGSAHNYANPLLVKNSVRQSSALCNYPNERVTSIANTSVIGWK